MSHFLVLTAAKGVADAQAAQVREIISGARPNRLSDCSVEIACAVDAPDVLIPGLDANLVSGQNRRKKLLIADMDSTIIPVECIDELADFAGVKTKVAAITERAMRGELNFEDAIHARVKLLKNLPESALSACYAERVSLNPGAKTLVQTMNALGAMTALVSGGFTYFTSRVAKRAGFQINRANTLCFADGKMTGKVQTPILGQQAKLDSLHQLCADGGYQPADVLAVGDGANDSAMVGAAGLGVAYRAKPVLAKIADARLEHSDLRALLALQGIAQSEYIS
ncbi:MAG: phosphoserine phosphatase SerB [Paracoccaceae bacterium]